MKVNEYIITYVESASRAVIEVDVVNPHCLAVVASENDLTDERFLHHDLIKQDKY